MPAPDAAVLKEKALALLAHLDAIRQAGGGSLPMVELFATLGTPADPELQAQLEARGPLEVSLDGDAQGAFHNSGPAFSTRFGPGKLIAPLEIAGRITWQDGGVVLHFDPHATILGKALFLELKLHQIEVSQHHIAVRLPGGVFDQEYRF